MKTAGILLASLFLATAAHAQADDISLGTPGYGGSGCPANSVAATLSPDGKALSLLFDEYVVEAGGETGKSFDRKTCNVAIPVHVPQGRSVSVLAIDYRGFNQLPRGARSQFNVEYFFAGTRGPAFRQTFTGPQEKDYLISNKLTAESLVWSACGEDVNLRTNSSIRVNTTRGQEAMATVDTQDVKAAIIYQLQWRKCR
ncbi:MULTISPECIES: DUF4360 domain-containing protein [unclassified Shinella]|jgi:hypothetical protein|uniref:DUF4360 domain-containing protein n=1 Tax=unclassified Shinella TaxID=2643062 RepID=UPI0003C53367|nr:MULTISPECIES: DUF4360 domain-containing protein [unclassified Shinella]MCA0342265.1 DUF4360 domain-containing protein [Pseudomonadota bacterium]EYR81693.1 putative secreted protein [Shinella sp. DD12]KNY14302.1 hypothetical protein AKG11_24175 [Shinella sp. SUS2]KOC71716.1 hypothetical protein AKG10_31380 [Shinella sp. GWS1]MCO5154120.1 DUF4360 domain-containing protein [Shinella sp.]